MLPCRALREVSAPRLRLHSAGQGSMCGHCVGRQASSKACSRATDQHSTLKCCCLQSPAPRTSVVMDGGIAEHYSMHRQYLMKALTDLLGESTASRWAKLAAATGWQWAVCTALHKVKVSAAAGFCLGRLGTACVYT